MMNANDILTLGSLLKESILEGFSFQKEAIVVKWLLYFSNLTGEQTQHYTLTLHQGSSFTLATPNETLSHSDVNILPVLQLLILAHNPIVTEPGQIELHGRVIHPPSFQYASAKVNLSITGFTISDVSGTVIPLNQLLIVLGNHTSQLLQPVSKSFLKVQAADFLKNDLSQLLVTNGFKGKSSFYFLPSASSVCVVEVIKSKWNSAQAYAFILRLHVFGGNYKTPLKIKRLEDLFTPTSVLLFSKNISPVKGNHGLNYTINGRLPLQLLHKIIEADLAREVWPVVEKLKTKGEMLQYLTTLNHQAPHHPYTWQLAILQGIWGNTVAASALFETANIAPDKISELKRYYNIT